MRSARARNARLHGGAIIGGLIVALFMGAPADARGQETRGSAVAFWQSLGDTTLTRLIGTALAANPDLRAAEARTGTARAARNESALDLAPVVTASAGYSRQRMASATLPGAGGPLPDQGMWDAGLRMSWDVDVFGRGRRSLQANSALVAAAGDDVQDVGVLVAAEVARAYLELRGAQHRLAVAQRNADNQRRTLELTLARLDAGRGTALDTERAQAQLSSTLADIPLLEAGIAMERNRLAMLTGSAAAVRTADLTVVVPLVLPEERALEQVAEVVLRRPDVRSAASRAAAGREMVGAARAGYLPRLTISAGAGYTAHAFDALGNTGTPRYTVGPVLSWPLLDIGRVRTRVDAARARELEAMAQHEQAVLRAREEIETSRAGYHSARARLRHLEEAAAASERATDIARLRFEEGGSDFLEVLDAERRLLEAQDRLAAGRTDAALWLVRVYRAHRG